jgi:hypothetical protein
MEKEKLFAKIKEANSLKNQLLQAPLESLHNLSGAPKKTDSKEETKQQRGRVMNSANQINKPIVKEEAVKASSADNEDEEATVIETGKKEGKKNRKKKNKGGQ